MISKDLDHKIDEAAELLSLLGNSKRLAIVGHLLEGELSVGSIAEKVELSQSALSQHLAKLRNVNMVETRRDRQMIYYSCNSEPARQLIETLEGIYSNGKHTNGKHTNGKHANGKQANGKARPPAKRKRTR